MSELLLGALVLGAIYMLDGGRMSKIADLVREFLDYLEQQQTRG